MILCIETSTDVCSVALCAEGKTLKSIEYDGEPQHASRLAPMIADLMSQSSLAYRNLDAVAVSQGPGSYTGLRIGASTAKGIAYAAGIKLIAVPTLSIIARAIFDADPDCRIACPMIDARRMEVYTSLISRDGQIISPTQALVADENSFGTELAHNGITFGGNGAPKCQKVITSPNASFLSGIAPLAKNMAQLAQDRLQAGRVESVAYFEPFYLKEFVATKSKNKVLNF
ncbi:MAG: tRNA (adenosine(37)-N6)-threonylcarbamoyltransferase complex dimerization subunit type 1 TsaB [Marinilabiliaceae bacterium]